MNDYSDSFMWAVVIVAFVAGYSIVSFIIKKLKGEQSNAKSNDQGTTSFENERKQENWNTLSEEERHAQVFGFKGPVTVSDVKKAYHKMLAKYHPDKVNHLGDEFKQIAEQKTREVVAAYEYFRRKYNIT